jgi:hypothetical protein
MTVEGRLADLGGAGGLALISARPEVIYWRREWGSPHLGALLAAGGHRPGQSCRWGSVAKFVRRQQQALESLSAHLTRTLFDIEVFEVGDGPVKPVFAVGHLPDNQGWAGLKFSLGWPP